MGWGVHAPGIRRVIAHVQRAFEPKGGILITENGAAVREGASLDDKERVAYLKAYLSEVHKAIVNDDADVRGYFVWSLLDNFEWGHGFSKRFGLVHVDFATLERTPKASAAWYSEVIARNRIEMRNRGGNGDGGDAAAAAAAAKEEPAEEAVSP